MLRTAALTLVSATLASCQYATAAPTVHIKNGSYMGVYSTEYNQDYFLGIPFAQPPVGTLRYEKPVSLNQSWSDVKPATTYSTECYGYGSDQWNYPVSEDCLYLNVIRPAGYENQTLPVAFWIHGGGFFQGGGIDQRYNTSFMVQNSVKIGKPIIAVNINYRLGPWGFLSGSEELKEAGALNLGLWDQRVALQWVQENIGEFGGDPAQVTIYGESAGAASVGFHLTAFSGRDDKLFRGAIMQSGNPIYFGALKDNIENANMYNELTRRTNCANQTSPLECLKLIPAEELNAAINITTGAVNVTDFMPILDGEFVQKRTSLQLEAGEFVKVPIIDGANSDEGSAFSPSPVNDTATFKMLVKMSGSGNMSDAFADQLLAAYPDDLSVNVIASLGNQRPPPPFGAQFRRSASYFGDHAFIAPRRRTCETWAAAGLPAYCYRFNTIPAGIPPFIGATHFQEVAFVFLNLEGVGYAPAAVPPFANTTESYANLARFMNSNWVSFVHDLDPNSWRQTNQWNGNEDLWPKYDLGNPLDMVFDANATSFAEPDTYRKEGMKLINDNALSVYGR